MLNTEEKAREYSMYLASPGSSDQEIEDISHALKNISAPFLEAIIQHGTKIRFLREGESYTDLCPGLVKSLSAYFPEENPEEVLSRTNGFYRVAEKTVYASDHAPGTIVHELGHAFDHALGIDRYNSRTDIRILESYARGEALNEYAAKNPQETFAECFRAHAGVGIEELDLENIDVHAYALEKSPQIMQYIAILEQAVSLALEKNPQAFLPTSILDRTLEIIVLSQAAYILGVDVREVDLEELRYCRNSFTSTQSPGEEAPRLLQEDKLLSTTIPEEAKSVDPAPTLRQVSHSPAPCPNSTIESALEATIKRLPVASPIAGMRAHVHENGEVSYRFSDLRSLAFGKDAFRDCGANIRLEDTDARAIRAAVAYAKKSWGDVPVILRVIPEVRETVLREALRVGLKVQNPELQHDIERLKAARTQSPFVQRTTSQTTSRTPEQARIH